MRNLRSYFILFAICISLSSCFEMVEELTFIDNSKGNYNLIMNCSQSRNKLNALFKLDSFMGVKIPTHSDILHHLFLAETGIRSVKGIHNVKSTVDLEKYIFSLQFDFDSTEALNKAILMATQTTTNKFQYRKVNIFDMQDKSFSRNETPGDSIAKSNSSNSEALKLIDGATLTSVYRFPKTISGISNKKAILSKNKKAVFLKQKFTDVLISPEILINSIIFNE